MEYYQIRKQKSSDSLLKWSAPLLIVAFLCACTLKVKLVGEYDEITDKTVSEIQEKTEAFFEKLQSASNTKERSFDANQAFYHEIQGKITLLITRAKITEEGLKRNPLTKNFNDLQTQFNDLKAAHKAGLLEKKTTLESARKSFDQAFRAILKNLLFLKWNQTTKPDK